jgi:hypothetical protein
MCDQHDKIENLCGHYFDSLRMSQNKLRVAIDNVDKQVIFVTLIRYKPILKKIS